MKTVAELISRIESRFAVGLSTTTALAVTGEPYVVIGCQRGIPQIPGTLDEGAAHEMAFDEETACWSALSCFDNYTAWWRDENGSDAVPILYWRIKPQLEWESKWAFKSEKPFSDGIDRCKVYMRCLLSNKPALQKRVSIQDHGYIRIGAVHG